MGKVLKNITLPKNLEYMGKTYYSADDETGVLYSKDMTSLLFYSRARQASYFDIPETVAMLAPDAFIYYREF